MSTFVRALQYIAGGALAVVFFAGVLLFLIVAWWLTLLALTGWLVYAGVRHLVYGARPVKRGGSRSSVIIEGEYRVEVAEPLPRPASEDHFPGRRG